MFLRFLLKGDNFVFKIRFLLKGDYFGFKILLKGDNLWKWDDVQIEMFIYHTCNTYFKNSFIGVGKPPTYSKSQTNLITHIYFDIDKN